MRVYLLFSTTTILLVVALSMSHVRADDNPLLTSSEEQEYEDANQSDDLSKEDDSKIESPELQEDLAVVACEKNGMCVCTGCKKCIKKTAGEMNCERATRRSGGLLDTANLRIRPESNPGFIAYSVNLKHNDIDILRRGQVLPGREAEVEYLDVSFNRIEDVEPYTFESFTKLAKLKLTHNRLRDNEISVDWLTPKLGRSLHQLHLDFNYLINIEEGVFDNLVNLTKLVLDGNKGLKLTARTFGSKLLKLKTLSLDECGLEDLDEDIFKQLPSLTDLSLSGNLLHSIPLSALQAIPKLSILAMSETPMEVIPKLAFDKLTTLTHLYLRRMPSLKTIDDCAFCRLTNLETIDLSYSLKLSNIHQNALGGDSDTEVPLDSLQYLHLSQCNISELDVRVAQWSGLKRLGLGGNPWNCDCKLKWLLIGENKQQKLLHKLVGAEQPTCAMPDQLKGATLAEAAESGDFTCEGFISPTGTGDATFASGGQKMTLALVLIGLVGSLFIVGVVYARRKGLGQTLYFGGNNGGAGWPSINAGGDGNGNGGGGPSLGYANLPRHGGNHVMSHRPDSDEDNSDDDAHPPEFV